MRRRLLPLSALRAFEAAARHASFVRAADELGVTTSAISRQVAELERVVGGPLFVRGVRRVELTPEALELQASLSSAFDSLAPAIETAKDRIRSRKPYAPRLRVHLLPTLATRIVIPRLPEFEAECPDLSVAATVSERGAGGDRTRYDFAIGYSRAPPPGRLELLFQEEALPVCSPAYLAEASASDGALSMAELTGLRLLSATEDSWDWKLWFASCEVQWPRDPNLMLFETDDLAIQAALAGTGLALVESRFVVRELAEGRLVAPILHQGLVALGYYTAKIAKGPRSEGAQAFSRWLRNTLNSIEITHGFPEGETE
jgi:LysR family transcriptional regulator, glycine cleavage system transcriptional activator